jgi:serine/threonine protein phosphatase 1
MIYVMSDIHGCFDEFLEMLNKIKFSNNDELYIIGDVVDRGPKPIELLLYLMEHKNNIHLVKGNHEDMMFRCLVPPYHSNEERTNLINSFELQSNRDLWVIYNGGNTTAKGYNKLTYEEQSDIYYFLEALKSYQVVKVEDKSYLLLHGGPPAKWDFNDEKVLEDILWTRIEKADFESDLVPGYHLIVGHTPTVKYGKEYTGKIIEGYHKFLIDCGCVFGYTLGCLCLNDGRQYYI